MLKKTLLGLTLVLLFPLPAMALPTITCHCFTDRSYDPSRPAAADPYFLASIQNTFFAAVFDIDKKSIVKKKQKGTAMEDLWVAYWVADKSGLSPEVLLQARQEKNNWREVLDTSGLSAESLGAPFFRILASANSDPFLDRAVVDELFARYQLLEPAELEAVRQSGASNPELIIATLISTRTGQAVERIYQEVKVGNTTWGELLDGAKIDLVEMQKEVSALLKLTAG
ncbi:hypothetical protein [Desulfuromonas versatilis]|nr:hypothetical protein [Desulfuromonas versatilis]